MSMRSVRSRTLRCAIRGPIWLYVGRVAVEKNIEAFLELDLPGTKVVVGDGPARAQLERRYPAVKFVGPKSGEDLVAALFRQRRVRVSQPHRHVRPRDAGSAGLRRAGRGVPVQGPRDVVGDAPWPRWTKISSGVSQGARNPARRPAISPSTIPGAPAPNNSWRTSRWKRKPKASPRSRENGPSSKG